MLKKAIAIFMIVFAAGAWGYLDYLNKQEQLAAEQSRKDIEAMRAKAKARAEAIAKFQSEITAQLDACKLAAETAKADFIIANQVPVKRKPGEFTIPAEVEAEATTTLDAANATCQSTYDSRFANGS